MLPHTFGWVCGQLLLRDWRMAWLISVLFEFYELSLMHWLPNFHECWWDHVFVDVLICNAAGIQVGLMIMRACRMQEYDWLGVMSTTLINCTYAISFVRFVQVNTMLLMISLMMLNAFFLKTVLWVPSDHWLNVARLLLWYCTAPAGVTDYYRTCVPLDERRHRGGGRSGSGETAGRYTLLAATILLESVLWIKCGLADFIAPFPVSVVRCWQAVAVIFGAHTINLAVSGHGKQPD